MENNLTKRDVELITRLAGNYGLSESKIVEHIILSKNPLKTLLHEVDFYKPNEEFLGSLLILIGKKLYTYIK